jgi:hypothetical protein
MHTDPILTHRLAPLILDERRAEAARATRRCEARRARSADRPGRAARRALGSALVRLGTSLGGAALDRPATWPA